MASAQEVLRDRRSCRGGEFADIAIRSTASALLLAALTGCVSYSYVDDRNVHHIVGFVDVAIGPADGSPGDAAASAVRVTSLGFSAYSHPDNGAGVVLGYSEETLLMLPNNSCIDLNSAGPCSSEQRPPAVDRSLGKKQP